MVKISLTMLNKDCERYCKSCFEPIYKSRSDTCVKCVKQPQHFDVSCENDWMDYDINMSDLVQTGDLHN